MSLTARDRLRWIDAVARDLRVSSEAFRLAHILQSTFINSRTGEAWPSQETLAGLLGIRERQVRNLINDLVSLGWLDKRRAGNGQPNRYRLTGSGIAGPINDSAEELAEEPRGGAKPPPGSALRLKVEDQRSTAKGRRDAPLGAPSPPRRYKVQDDISISEIGPCTVISISSGALRLRSYDTGEYLNAVVDADGYILEDRVAWETAEHANQQEDGTNAA